MEPYRGPPVAVGREDSDAHACYPLRPRRARRRGDPGIDRGAARRRPGRRPAGVGRTRLLRTPTVSAGHIAFAYASNIWIVERAGGTARRVTSFQGQASNPQLSPDGRQLAFSADYAGNADVYVVPVEGGEPTRLTWHPGPDLVQGWTPDGAGVLFTSPRATASPIGHAALLDGARRRRHRRCRWPCRAASRASSRPMAAASPTG